MLQWEISCCFFLDKFGLVSFDHVLAIVADNERLVFTGAQIRWIQLSRVENASEVP